MRYITIALAKGRLYSGATDLYVTISISRKLAHVEEEYGEELQNIK